uniref:Uncharacterized protein n=1 Tax=Moniliophthora roreri TaxID=221103 RepID=A0A0W0EYD7_MONRR
MLKEHLRAQRSRSGGLLGVEHEFGILEAILHACGHLWALMSAYCWE